MGRQENGGDYLTVPEMKMGRKDIYMDDENKLGTLIIGVIGEDVHIAGIIILEHALRDAGFRVVSLGAQVTPQEFVNAAVEANADGILISSYSGHAEILVDGFKEKCIEAGLGHILLLIGGYLLLEEKPWKEIEAKFKGMGFDGVYPPGTKPTKVIADLHQAYLTSRQKKGGHDHK
jgi:methylaspartate mutase sigma subunit